MGSKDLWNELTDEQKKSLKSEFFILNRYVSNVKSNNREVQEHFVLTVNEYFNKHWNTLQNHPKLLWLLLCMCSHESKKIFYHEWIGYKKKKPGNKIYKFLEELYPNKKLDEIELLSQLYTEEDCKILARDHGFDEKQIQKIFK
jgi:hypothetical protein